MCVAAAVVFPLLFFITAPYGRHGRRGFGPGIPARLGWVAMEIPSVLLFGWVFFRGEQARELVPLLLLGLWQLHYLQRTFLFPLLMKRGPRPMPFLIPVMAFLFNCANSSLNAYALTHMGPRYGSEWLADPRFLIGVALFATGYAINLHSDARLRRLRQPGETGYRIPRGGLFRWVSCPNYFGEILEWCGWALAAWTAAGFAFAIFTIANLAPRARAHHRWYRQHFPDYPPHRKALLPTLW